MKNISTMLIILTLVACNNLKKNHSEKDSEQTKVDSVQSNEIISIGGNKDKHGCLTAAGLTWSELKQDCIQVFKVGKRLNPIDKKENEAIISAFVVFNNDQSKVELFIPNNDAKTVVLNKTSQDVYENKIYKFDAKQAILYISGTKMYQAENKYTL